MASINKVSHKGVEHAGVALAKFYADTHRLLEQLALVGRIGASRTADLHYVDIELTRHMMASALVGNLTRTASFQLPATWCTWLPALSGANVIAFTQAQARRIDCRSPAPCRHACQSGLCSTPTLIERRPNLRSQARRMHTDTDTNTIGHRHGHGHGHGKRHTLGTHTHTQIARRGSSMTSPAAVLGPRTRSCAGLPI